MTTPSSTRGVRTDGRSGRTRAPWATVLLLGPVATFGSEFWVVAIRGAVGAIQRAQGPFGDWLRESALTLPVYLTAVLAALTWAGRRQGARQQRVRDVALALGVVALATTAVTAVVLAVNAVVDYRLQATLLVTMSSHGTCTGGCLAAGQRSAALLQARAVGLGTLATLVSNLALLGTVVLLRGGRLPVR
ncbi:MAG: hypothetical protein HOQ22_01530 [Nocardioidaceae bacterium]|nr:hypothetical protein [Nocardioidaceae bacterium]NUS49708.1 hypothetical protein [Nocardioidaceae bacterium]